MAIKQIGQTAQYAVKEYMGLSTDVKPTSSDNWPGSTFYETDTKNGYIFDGSTWWGV